MEMPPKLIFTEETLGLEQKKGRKSDIARAFTSRADHILRSHSSTGVTTLKFVIPDCYNVSTWQLNSWHQKAVTPEIEEVTLSLPSKYRAKYNFPCSILFDGRGNSIRSLDLTDCTFQPTVGFDCLRSLTKLRLHRMRVTGDELGCLLSNCFALEKLELRYCHELICLKIPFLLEGLSCLSVAECSMLQVIESTAPNLSNFDFLGEPVQLSLGASSKVKNANLGFLDERNSISYAITKLPSIVPHLETLTVCPSYERGKTPMVAYKFFHLKYLMIDLIPDDDGDGSPAYDYLSLASFLYASPVLETFILSIDQYDMEHDSVFGDASPMRQIPDHKHDRLKKVEINGFCSAKSMVELTCHILENATSLESVTLDGIYGEYEDGSTVRCKKIGKCKLLSKHMILEAHKHSVSSKDTSWEEFPLRLS
ncbi:hypothetical protein ACP70R_010839 [Stipagrostis hirtigluma subsp. patula]